MGILNVTPDSFSDGGKFNTLKKALKRAKELEKQGADIIDIGGESTGPGSKHVSLAEELKRVIPVIEGIRKRSSILISNDTYRPEVAKRVADCGADIVNDISGLSYNNGLEFIVAEAGTYIILMHIRGKPFDMQQHVLYDDVITNVSLELDNSIEKALGSGIDKSRIIIDPGIGFAKSAEHNLTLIKNLPLIKKKGYPVLIGLSRKSFLGAYTGLPTEKRLIPTVAANAISIFQGADIIRVHDVDEAKITARIADAIKSC